MKKFFNEFKEFITRGNVLDMAIGVIIATAFGKITTSLVGDVLGPKICAHVKTLVLCGATADKIRAAVENAPEYRKGAPEILEANDLREAVALCQKAAQPGDIVTLSPACAAFDQFKNFAVRGKAFKELVGSLT